MSGADLEYAAMLARAGIDPTSEVERKHMDAARLEQINDTNGFGTAVERAKSQIRTAMADEVDSEGPFKTALLASTGAQIEAEVPPQVAAALAADDAPAQAAATAVDTALDTSDRIPRKTSHPDFAVRWQDAEGYEMGGFKSTDGALLLHQPVDAPGVGVLTDTPGYSRVTLTSDATRMLEDGLDSQGQVPAWVARNVRVRGAGTRRVGLSMTLPGDANTTTATAGASEDVSDASVRLALRVPANTLAWRVHVRNYNDKTDSAYPGAVSFRGFWLGDGTHDSNGDLTGSWRTRPSQVINAFTTPSNASEYVSGWITDPAQQLRANRQMMLAYGFTTTGGQVNHLGRGGCWRTSAATDAELMTPGATPTLSIYAPFDIWIEAVVPGDVPYLVVTCADSLSVGTGSTLPVHDSWAHKAAIAGGVWPLVHAHHGSNLGQWADVTQWKWRKFGTLSHPDAIVIAGGSNDIFGSSQVDLPTGQTRLRAATLAARKTFGQDAPLYLASVLPRTGSTAPNEAVRVTYNDWLLTLPVGARSVLPLADAVANPTNAAQLDSRFNSGDGVHLNSAGYAQQAIKAIPHPLAVAHPAITAL